MPRSLAFAYGLVSYLLFFGCFVYSIGFIGDLVVPKTIDTNAVGGTAAMAAVTVNLLLLSLFALQHSGMARPAFKRWWARFVPEPIERSTYVLLSTAVLAFVYWQWRPIAGVVWEVDSGLAQTAILALYLGGWGLVFYSTILISHFDLFGLRQVTLYAQGRRYEPLPFETPSLYRFIRHPLYVGWMTVLWAAPTMTLGHLLFAGVCTAYILVAVQLEENDLVDHFGERYVRYRDEVPMFVPAPGRTAGQPPVRATS